MARLTLVSVLLAIGCGAPADTALPGADGGASDAADVADGAATPDADSAPDAAVAYDFAPVIAEVAAEVETATGGDISIAVMHLPTEQAASFAGAELHVSASSAKAFWVAAALDAVGVDAVEPFAGPIFESSDNYAAGSVIDLVGPNQVNEFLWTVAGMDDTALTRWSFGQVRVATNSPNLMNGNNYFTADDSVEFLRLLYRGDLLGPAETAALRQWMTLSPSTGYGGWAGDRLPTAAADSLEHKSGWLPPGCCSMPYHTLVDIGIAQTGAGPYAYAILLRYGDWDVEQSSMAYASCRLHAAVARIAPDCGTP